MRVIALIFFIFSYTFSFGQEKVQSNLLNDQKLKSGNFEDAILEYSNYIKSNPSNYKAFLLRGIAKSSLGKFSYAILDYDTSISLYKKDYLPYYIRSESYFDLGRYDESLNDLKIVLKLKPNYSNAFHRLSKNYLNKSDTLKSLLYLDSAILYDPNAFESMMDRVEINLNLKKYGAAISDLNRIVKANPDYQNGLAFIKRGFAYTQIGRFKEGILDYDNYLKKNPSPDVFYFRSIAKLLAKDTIGALKDRDLAVNTNPSSYLALIDRGLNFAKKGKFKLAFKDFDKAVEINGFDYQLFYNRGLTYLNLNKINESIADFSRSLELNPNYLIARSKRGYSYFVLGKFKEAIMDFTEIIVSGKEELKSYAFEMRGLSYLKYDSTERAIEDFNLSISLNPQNPSLYLYRSNAFKKNGDYSYALDDINKALEIAPKRIDFLNKRADCNMAMNQFEEAIIDYSKAIKIDSSKAQLFNERGLAKIKFGDYEGAIKDFTLALNLDTAHQNNYFINRAYSKSLIGDKKGAKVDFLNASPKGVRYDTAFYKGKKLMYVIKNFNNSSKILALNSIDGSNILESKSFIYNFYDDSLAAKRNLEIKDNIIIEEYYISSGDTVYVQLPLNDEFYVDVIKFQFTLGNELSYPKLARSNKIEGVVKLNFIVKKNGEISNIHFDSKLGYEFEEKVFKFIRRYKNFGIVNYKDRPINFKISQPINFKMQNLD